MNMKRIGLSVGVFAVMAGRVMASSFVSPAAEPPQKTSAAVFEKREVNAERVRRAVWKVSGQGVFEAYVNGRLVGDDFLKPGFTECGKCRHVYTYDVTDLLSRGKGATNRLAATVAPGWWCDAMMSAARTTPWQLGRKVAFYGELDVTYEDGRRATFGTDASWRAAYTGPVVSAGIYEGEVYDARRTVGELAPVAVNGEFRGEMRPAAAKVALRRDLTMKPVSLTVTCGAQGASSNAFGTAQVVRRVAGDGDIALAPGERLTVDFGQNAAAVPSFTVTGAPGTEVTIRHAEMLNEASGEKSRGNDGPAGTPYLASLRSARAQLTYVLGAGENAFMPRHTFFGYRYLAVTATGPVTFRAFRSVPVSSVTKDLECGSIVTGDGRVNRLIENIRWGVLSNYLSIPTDCPQRDERMGWTADTQVFMNSAAYLLDTYGFLSKYLADLRDAQYADGLYPCFAPNLRHVFQHWASCGWTDAGVIIPYRLWKWYGQDDVITANWPAMKRYMDFLETHENPYRINHGDWLAFEHTLKKKDGSAREAPDPRQVHLLNDAFRVILARLMREMAGATGRTDEARHFADEESKHRAVFASRYLDAEGCLRPEYRGQCNDLYAIRFGLCGNAAALEKTKRDLVDNIRAHGNRLQTGFLGTAILMPTLTFDVNAPELAYTLLLQDKFPSWLYSVDQGATTVWERWNGYTKEKGFGPVIMNSFNHYAYGCVLEWLFSAAAGIRPDPQGGWRHFILKPHPDRRLGSCEASYRSPFGTIRSAWRYAGANLVWQFSIPEGCRARVTDPDGATREYGPGSHAWRRTDETPGVNDLHIVHRGWGLDWPENSMEALRECWRAGFIPEADARVSKDGVLFAFHDAAYRKRPIGEMTWAEIRAINIAERKGGEWRGRVVHPPTLDEIFTELAQDPGRRIAMDHKTVPNEALLACARKHGVERQIWHCSGSAQLARDWKRLLPDGATVVWLYNGKWRRVNFADRAEYDARSAFIRERFEKLAAEKFRGIDMVELIIHVDLTQEEPFCPESAFLKDAFARIRAAGKIPCAMVWTDGDREETYRRLGDLDVATFATDYPVVLQRHLREK